MANFNGTNREASWGSPLPCVSVWRVWRGRTYRPPYWRPSPWASSPPSNRRGATSVEAVRPRSPQSWCSPRKSSRDRRCCWFALCSTSRPGSRLTSTTLFLNEGPDPVCCTPTPANTVEWRESFDLEEGVQGVEVLHAWGSSSLLAIVRGLPSVPSKVSPSKPCSPARCFPCTKSFYLQWSISCSSYKKLCSKKCSTSLCCQFAAPNTSMTS